jgi:hypothetical protein
MSGNGVARWGRYVAWLSLAVWAAATAMLMPLAGRTAGARCPVDVARVGRDRSGGDPMRTRTDKTLLILTAVFVAALAFVAGAISFAHMRELATHHDQLGWKSYAFPISVDGLEIVASLYLVAQRRAGRPPDGCRGWR